MVNVSFSLLNCLCCTQLPKNVVDYVVMSVSQHFIICLYISIAIIDFLCEANMIETPIQMYCHKKHHIESMAKKEYHHKNLNFSSSSIT